MRQPQRIGVLALSGGLDSTTLLHYAHKEMGFDKIHALSFQYGQKHLKELECAEYQAGLFKDSFTAGDEPWLHFAAMLGSSSLVAPDEAVPTLKQVLGDPQPSTYVPFRNLIILSICLSVAEAIGAEAVLCGVQRHDAYGYWDTTPAFIERVQIVVNMQRKHLIKVLAPFAEWSKRDEIWWGLQNDVDYSHTWSCYRGGEVACGVCPTCVERLTAFEQCGVVDPLPYVE
jgi:7-cyano-7-deazaguanine synthase